MKDNPRIHKSSQHFILTFLEYLKLRMKSLNVLITKNTRNNTIAPNDISMFLEEHPNFTRAQFATYFALSDKSAVRLINKMISEGIISASGEKRGVKYAKI